MKHCIYCRTDKEDADFTLEHVIPQFLGGAYVPDFLKTRDVCSRCNNNLGLFVDAGVEKDWIVSSRLRENAVAFFDPENPVGLPLVCMGISDFVPPDMPDGHVCELWLGRFGEQVYWIRPHDEKLYWFAGGNPRTVKNIESRAYFLFSANSHKNPLISWLAFRDAFEGRRIRKIMCTRVEGADPTEIGFSVPDELDTQRIEYFNAHCSAGDTRKNKISFNTRFDQRFLAKIAIGMSYCLFGQKVLDSAYGKELHRALWHKEGEAVPEVRGATMLSGPVDKLFNGLIGEPHAVSALLMSSPEGISANLNIGTHLNWTVMIASHEILNEDDYARIKDGFIVILFRTLQRGFSYELPRYIAYKTGNHPLPELCQIAQIAEKTRGYFSSL